jgi:hypothetical protein
MALVEAEEVGRADGVIGACDRLVLVMQIGERKACASANAFIASKESSG